MGGSIGKALGGERLEKSDARHHVARTSSRQAIAYFLRRYPAIPGLSLLSSLSPGHRQAWDSCRKHDVTQPVVFKRVMEGGVAGPDVLHVY